MKKHQKKQSITLIFLFVFLLSTSVPSLVSGLSETMEKNQSQSTSTISILDEPYTGRVRVYVVEPISRWTDCEGHPWHFGFLDLAANLNLSINKNDTDHRTIIWDANQAGFPDVVENNIMVMAVVFNPDVHQGIIDLPSPYEDAIFNAYYVDAVATATPGTPGENTVTEDFTHTVFCEEATGHHCPSCPSASFALNAIYESHDYPFYYTSFDVDSNPKALPRILEYCTTHVIPLPTCFFDGGFQVQVGGGEGCEARYRSAIEACGQRDCYKLNMSVSLAWLGSGRIQIDVEITNGPNPKKPSIGIGDITPCWKGFGGGSIISVEITNRGTAPAINIPWNISIRGGVLRRINIMEDDMIKMLAIDEKKIISAVTPVRGLGPIEIHVTAANEQKSIQGFIIGPFVVLDDM